MTERHLPRWPCAPIGALLCVLASPAVGQDEVLRAALTAPVPDYTTVRTPGPSLLPRNNTAPDPDEDRRAALGRLLFYDRRLSRNQTVSCGSCHEQERAFADGRARSRGFAGRRTVRNSMSIVNLRHHRGPLFWDGRAKDLETMVLMPIQDPVEMGLKLPDAIARLQAEPGYPPLFERAFGTPAIDEKRLATALAAFVRSIESFRSRYDAGLAATQNPELDFANFTEAENRGKRLFFLTTGSLRTSCAACHMQRLPSWCGHSFFIDPLQFDSEHCRNNGIDAGRRRDDPGQGGVTGKREQIGRFRAPSLRNIELTGPYMHDGRFATLEQVVDFYSRGIRAHPGLDPVFGGSVGGDWHRHVTTPAAPPVGPTTIVSPAQEPGLALDRHQRADLVAFLKTLTDRELLCDPRFADPFPRR